MPSYTLCLVEMIFFPLPVWFYSLIYIMLCVILPSPPIHLYYPFVNHSLWFYFFFIHVTNIYSVPYFVPGNGVYFTDYSHWNADVRSDIPEGNSFLTRQSFEGHCANNSLVVWKFWNHYSKGKQKLFFLMWFCSPLPLGTQKYQHAPARDYIFFPRKWDLGRNSLAIRPLAS